MYTKLVREMRASFSHQMLMKVLVQETFIKNMANNNIMVHMTITMPAKKTADQSNLAVLVMCMLCAILCKTLVLKKACARKHDTCWRKYTNQLLTQLSWSCVPAHTSNSTNVLHPNSIIGELCAFYETYHNPRRTTLLYHFQHLSLSLCYHAGSNLY